ncbi:MAG: hypothetical protein EOP53_02305 [Sphingobacteriales bacterium]|nr:MAG: hypothetical protein EOP53_02305 [Sphingobacteriales bacterium]
MKQGKFIHYSEMLKIIQQKDADGNPVKFSFSYIKADVNRITGGQEVFVSSAFAYSVDHAGASTVNIHIPKPGYKDKIRTIHTRLITKINNEEVQY